MSIPKVLPRRPRAIVGQSLVFLSRTVAGSLGYGLITTLRQFAIAVMLAAMIASTAWSQVGFTPSQIQKAYGINTLQAAGITGAGQTIAIIDPYDYPNALSAVNTFSSAFGLPQFNVSGGPTFTKLDQNGGTAFPGTDPAVQGRPTVRRVKKPSISNGLMPSRPWPTST